MFAAGELQPAPGWVIGPEGYWQDPLGAVTELMHGPTASPSQVPLPQNSEICPQACVTVGVVVGTEVPQNVENGLATSEALEDLAKAYPSENIRSMARKIAPLRPVLEIGSRIYYFDRLQQYCAAQCAKGSFER